MPDISNETLDEVERALRDCHAALAAFVDVDEKFRKAYEHPLSAFDRAGDALARLRSAREVK